jgi:WD40 repeat protein
MTDVFISYSRKDRAFAEKLHNALAQADRNAWIDWINIPETADWWNEIQRGIEAADTFVFIISPDSVISEVCGDEVDHAVRHNKRLIPVVWREGFDVNQIHSVLRRYNWLFFRESDDFDERFHRLIEVIDTDLQHTRAHTRLLIRTLEWENKGRNDSLLLRGDDLTDAECWLAQSLNKEPQPTEQQTNYITKSREAENAYQRIVQAARQAKRMIRAGSAVLGVMLLTAIVVGALTVRAFQQLNVAKTATRLEREGVNALYQFDFAELDALLVAVRSARELRSLVSDTLPIEEYPTTSPFVALQTILNNIQEHNQIKAHQRAILDVSFSPDGKSIVTASIDGTARLWNLAGEPLAELTGHQDAIYSASFSPNGQRVATASDDGSVRLWDLTGQQIAEFKGHQGRVFDANFSPDGQQIVTTGRDGTVRFWNLSGQQLDQLEPITSTEEFSGIGIQTNWDSETNTVKVVGVFGNSPAQKAGLRVGDRILAVDGEPGETHSQTEILDKIKGEVGTSVTLRMGRQGRADFDVSLVRTTFVAEVPKLATHVKFSPDGQQILTCGEDGTIRLWSISKEQLAEFEVNENSFWSCSFSPDGQRIATASNDGTVRLWDLSGQQLEEFSGHSSVVTSVNFSPDGNQLITSSIDASARLWNLEGQQIAEFRGHQGRVFDASFSPDGKQLVTGGGDGVARLWNLASQEFLRLRGWSQSSIGRADFSPDQQQIITLANDDSSQVRLWSSKGEPLAQFSTATNSPLRDVRFSPDGQQIASAGEDGVARLWTLEGTQIAEFVGHEATINAVRFSPDGQRLATASQDGTARLWDRSGQQLAELQGHQSNVWDIHFSPDGRALVTASGDGTARLWDQSGQQLVELKGHQGVVWGASFSPDGQQVVTAGADGIARLWNLSGQQLTELRGHQEQVRGASFSPDGKRIITTSYDGTIRLWNLSGQQLGEFRGYQEGIAGITSSSDGNELMVVSSNGVVQSLPVERLSLDQLLERGCNWLQDYLTHNPNVSHQNRQLCEDRV